MFFPCRRQYSSRFWLAQQAIGSGSAIHAGSRVGRVLGECHISRDSVAGRPQLEMALEELRAARSAVTVQWIAERFQMSAPGYVQHLLYRQRKAKGESVVNIKTRLRLKMATEIGSW